MLSKSSKVFRFGLVCSVVFINLVAKAGLPNRYQTLSAEEKLDLLWTEVETSEWQVNPPLSGAGWTSILKNIKALTSLKKSFDHQGDELPSGRRKLIHAYGVCSKISFIPVTDHPFTGLYRTGASGIARLSLAASPDTISYTPGIALKFMIDGKASVNLHLMNSLNGQGENWNFFANQMSNEIPPASGFALKTLEKIFERAKKPANQLPISHLAKTLTNGSSVRAPQYPQRLVFMPHSDVAKTFAAENRQDFRQTLGQIPEGTKLYNVYGAAGQELILIGTITSASEMISSQFGDKHLFFQHQR